MVLDCPIALETHTNTHVGTHLKVEDAARARKGSLVLSTNKGMKKLILKNMGIEEKMQI